MLTWSSDNLLNAENRVPLAMHKLERNATIVGFAYWDAHHRSKLRRSRRNDDLSREPFSEI